MPSNSGDLRIYKISLANDQIVADKKMFLDQTASGGRIFFSYYVEDGEKKVVAKASNLYLTKSPENRYESLIALPQQYAGKKLGVCIAGYRFESDVRFSPSSDITELKVFTYKGLVSNKKKGGSILGILVAALLFLLIGIAGGGFAGYKYHEIKKSPTHKCETCQGAFSSKADLDKHAQVHIKAHEEQKEKEKKEKEEELKRKKQEEIERKRKENAQKVQKSNNGNNNTSSDQSNIDPNKERVN